MSSDELFIAALLQALAAEGLEAIIVGATAAVMQGAPVMTQDVDILVRDTPRNREKLRGLYRRLNAHPMEHEVGGVQTLIGSDVPVDVIFDHLPGGLRFESIRSRSIRIPVGGETATVAALGDVIASKKAANRPKDRAQLPILESTLRVRQQMTARDPGDDST